MVLTTGRLILRPYRATDFAAVHAYASDPEVTRYVSFGPNTPDETRDFLARCETATKENPRRSYNYAIALRDSDQVIGGIGFVIDQPAHRGAELGYVLHREHWGRGITTEAVEAILHHAFNTADLHRVIARCAPENPASARVMQKAGMQYEGRQREVMWLKGRWWDFLVYSVLEHEWRAGHASPKPCEEII